ncbi:MAG: hypothetical protein H0X04_03335 [Chthoniobacterales bacterium]|nr:hypothetical protein [Chthoniobacterales bacterium]
MEYFKVTRQYGGHHQVHRMLRRYAVSSFYQEGNPLIIVVSTPTIIGDL